MNELQEWAWQQYNEAARSSPGTDYALATWRIHLAALSLNGAGMPDTKTRTKILLVESTYYMDKETFAMHFTMRHGDSLAGQPELPAHMDSGTELAYRAFHDRLHQTRTRAELRHEHEPEPEEAGLERALRSMQENRTKGWSELAGHDGLVQFRDDGVILVKLGGRTTRFGSVEDAADFLMASNEGEDEDD